MASDEYIILYEKEGITYKICRIFFGSDGSYYVTSPYHPAHKAFLDKVTVNYAKDTMDIPFEDLIDSASADDEKALKLTHHTSGLIQFSGGSLRSGAGGFSIQSWPLNTPVRGPAFTLTLRDVEKYKRADGRLKGERCVFRHRELTPVSGADVLHLEGYYFPELWRRFVQTSDDGERSISILHPAGVVLRLKVLFPDPKRHLQGFFGLEMYTDRSEEGFSGEFILASSTGNIRLNDAKELLGDLLFCMYPRGDFPVQRSLMYIPPTMVAPEGAPNPPPDGPSTT